MVHLINGKQIDRKTENKPKAIATEYGSLEAISEMIASECLTATGSANKILQSQ